MNHRASGEEMIHKCLFRKILAMKRFTVVLVTFLLLGLSFYGLNMISKQNECTSVRKYVCIKKQTAASTGTLSTSWSISTQELTWTVLSDQSVINDLSKNLVWVTKWYSVTNVDYRETADSYIITYSWKDNIVVTMPKDRYWVDTLTINWIPQSRHTIDWFFKP